MTSEKERTTNDHEIDGIDAVIYSPVCARCRRFTGTKPRERTCEAYPDGIPPEIWLGDHDHTEAYTGDGGKQFLPRLGVRPKPGDTARFSGSMTVVSGEDTRTPDDVRKASRVYLREGEDPPEGVQVKTGPRGGRYYSADRATHPERFHPIPRTERPPVPEDLLRRRWLTPEDNPHPPGTLEADDWTYARKNKFLNNPFNRKTDGIAYQNWIVDNPDRKKHHFDTAIWQEYRRVEEKIEQVGVPKGHEWALRRPETQAMANREYLEREQFNPLSEEERRRLKAEGAAIPYEYDPDVSKDEYDAIHFYVGYGYEPIKIALRPADRQEDRSIRSWVGHLSDHDIATARSAIEKMDITTQRERVVHDQDLFHGVKNLIGMEGPYNPDDLHPGDLLSDDSFTSWSLDPWVSYHFTGHTSEDLRRNPDSFDHPVVVRIQHPKGLPGAFVGGGEREYILPRGISYRVLAIDDVGVDPRCGEVRRWTAATQAGEPPEVHWKVITVEPVLEETDRVQKGERIYVTPQHPAPRGVTLHRGPAGGVFYFGERGDAKPAGGSGPQAGPPETPSPRGRPNKPPAAGGSREEGGPRKDLARSQSRFHRRPEGEGVEVEFHTIEELRTTLAETRFGLISAGRNPKREADEPEETFVKRHEQLRADLAALGYVYTQVLGSYGEFEDSFRVMAHDADRDPLVELGRKYNQDSIIWTDRGTNHMIYTTDSTDDDGNPIAAGSYLKGEGFEEISLEEGDFFTEVYLKGSGANARFSLNFEWGDLHPPEGER